MEVGLLKLFLSIALFAALLLCPAASADGVRDGLSLAAREALPALFPFFAAGALLVRTGAAARLSRLFARPLHRLYGLPPDAAPAVLLGLTGGYPVGAATTANLLREGRLGRADASRVLSFCNCASPGFCIGLVGLGVFGSTKTGAVLYGIHAVSALLTGLVTARFGVQDAVPATLSTAPDVGEAFAPAFCGAVQDAAGTSLTVTAFLTVFSVLLALLSPIFVGFSGAPFAAGLLELTNGLDHLSALPVPSVLLPVFASFLLGFGGLAVQFQVRAIAAPFALSLRRFTLGKLLHGLIAAALTLCLIRLSPSALPAFAPTAAQTAPVMDWTGAVLLLFLILFPFWDWKRGGK